MRDEAMHEEPSITTGSLGSVFTSFRVPPAAIPELAEKIDWNLLGRRVVLDPVSGFISWMSPSTVHETYADAADEVVKATARILGLKARALRGSRWKIRPEHPDNTGVEPDACFYVSAHAEAWYIAAERSDEDALAFEARTPPDLVIEIEATRSAPDKPQSYARLGVPEMWRARRRRGRKLLDVELLDLLSAAGPTPIQTSCILPGLSGEVIPEALGLARLGRFEELERLLTAVLRPRPAVSPARPGGP